MTIGKIKMLNIKSNKDIKNSLISSQPTADTESDNGDIITTIIAGEKGK